MRRLRISKDKYGMKGCGGFTLIELITVLLIVGIVAAVVVSASVYSGDTRGLDPQAEVLKGHLRYAQAMAIQSDKNWGIYIIDASHYCLFRDGSTAESNRFYLPGENNKTYELPSGFAMSPAGAIVSFGSGWGIPSTSATSDPPATENISLTMTKGSDSATITITKNTGFIP